MVKFCYYEVVIWFTMLLFIFIILIILYIIKNYIKDNVIISRFKYQNLFYIKACMKLSILEY